MTVAEEKGSFVARSSLNRVITYRPHVRWTYRLVLLMGLFYFGILAISVFFKSDFLVFDSQEQFFSAEIVLFSSSLWIFLLLVNQFLYKPTAFSVVTVKPRELEILKNGKTQKVPFEDVEKINFFLPAFVGGAFVLQLKDKSTQAFTINLERSEYILEALYSFNPNLVPSENIEMYRRRLIIADQSNARSYERLQKWNSVLTKYMIVPAVISLIQLLRDTLIHQNVTGSSVVSNFPNYFFVSFAWNTVVGMIIFIVIDTILRSKDRQRLTSNPNFVRRDLERDAKYFKSGDLIYWTLVLTITFLT